MEFKRLLALFALALFLFGCSGVPLNPREKGVLWGGGLGAAGGALIGAATGSPGTGALIGGGAGALAGGLIGDYQMGQEVRSYRHARLARRHRGQYARRHRYDLVE